MRLSVGVILLALAACAPMARDSAGGRDARPDPRAQSVASEALAAVRPGTAPTAGGVNVAAFALSTTHRVGTPRYPRSRLTLQNAQRNCAAFASADLAQEEFLRRGGPERDPLNLDPDGDGFACFWSPEPFRAAARAAL